MKIRHKVWFGRARAILWLTVGIISFPLGWANSVVLVWIASFYANAESGFATGEAADDRQVLGAVAQLTGAVAELTDLVKQLQLEVRELKTQLPSVHGEITEV